MRKELKRSSIRPKWVAIGIAAVAFAIIVLYFLFSEVSPGNASISEIIIVVK